MCFTYIKRNCGKTWKLSVVFMPLLTIFMYLASVLLILVVLLL